MSRGATTTGWTREQIAARVAMDIADGSYVNLGIGIPELVAGCVPEGRTVVYHTENGLIGMGPSPESGAGDPELINAGKRQVTAMPGAAYFHHADSFAMVRGGHLDVAVLGAFQVAENGDLANWSTGPGSVPAVGGAMDLVHGAKQIWIVTDHVTKKGEPKLLKQCTLPLTGVGCVTTVYTSLAVFDVIDKRFVLREKLPTMSLDELQAVTEAEIVVKGTPGDLNVPELCSMAEAFICDYIRTPIGRFGGVLAQVRTDDLGAVPLRALMERNGSPSKSSMTKSRPVYKTCPR